MNSSRFSVSCVLFDLDGTLIDTLPDINNALNIVLRSENRKEIPQQTLRGIISHGTTAILNHAFGTKQTHLELERRRADLLEYYAENICVDTLLFAGMQRVLNELSNLNIACGIVTNKPKALAYPLLQQLNIKDDFCSIVCGDTLKERKPSPIPLYTAAEQCHALATQCIYVGDSQNDMLAANQANMISLLASYGYIGKDDRPEQWQANGIIQSPEEILDWLDYQPLINHDQRQQCH